MVDSSQVGAIALLFQDLSDRSLPVRVAPSQVSESEHADGVRIAPRHDARPRGTTLRRRAEHALEDDRFSGEGVDVRRVGAGFAVAVQMRSEVVHYELDDVRFVIHVRTSVRRGPRWLEGGRRAAGVGCCGFPNIPRRLPCW